MPSKPQQTGRIGDGKILFQQLTRPSVFALESRVAMQFECHETPSTKKPENALTIYLNSHVSTNQI